MYIPEELVRAILLKLPSTKSAVRLSRVFKSWHDLLLKDPDFGNEFFNNVGTKTNDPILVIHRRMGFKEHEYQLRTSDSAARLRFPYDIRKLKEIGSCNGILCLQEIIPDLGLQVHLYNPITGEHQIIGDPCPGVVGFGFGFDSDTGDYKVVRIKVKNYSDYLQGNVRKKLSAEIYRFSTKFWSHLDHVDFEITCGRRLSSKFVYAKNGCCYWASASNITAFNFRRETIDRVSLPPSGSPFIWSYDLGLLDDSLAVCVTKPTGKSVDTEIWIKGKEGEWINCYFLTEVVLRSQDSFGRDHQDEEGYGACWSEDGGLYQLKPNGKVATLQKRVRKEAKTKLFRFDCPLYSMAFKPSLVSLRS